MTRHPATLLMALVEAHHRKILPKGGATAREIAGNSCEVSAVAKGLRMLESQGYVRGTGWPQDIRRYAPTLSGFRTVRSRTSSARGQ